MKKTLIWLEEDKYIHRLGLKHWIIGISASFGVSKLYWASCVLYRIYVLLCLCAQLWLCIQVQG